MPSEEYIYQAVSVHLREKELLDENDIERLIRAKGIDEVYAILGEKGWNTAELSPGDATKLLTDQENLTWGLVENLTRDLTPFHVLVCVNDYHNLKAAIKLDYSNIDTDLEQYFLKGSIDSRVIIEAAKTHDFSGLPPIMAEAGKEAYLALAHTGNGQYCDMIIDRAALIAIDEAGKETKSSLLKEYAGITVDSANIKAAIRCCHMNKQRDFIERAIAPAGTLDTKGLINAALENIEAVYAYLSRTVYADAVDELKQDIGAFERWCDDRIIEMIRPEKYNFYTIDPIAAYILARLTELHTVKFILSAKINALDMSIIAERLRKTYV